MSIAIVPVSQNRKTGPMATTYASISGSCPCDCPLAKPQDLRNGLPRCYGQKGRCNILLQQLEAKQTAEPRTPIQLARMEAAGLGRLSLPIPCRVHVFGDCREPDAASVLGSAMDRYSRRHGPAYTYTQAWRNVPYSAWGNAVVWASCTHLSDVKRARDCGYTRVALISKNAIPGGIRCCVQAGTKKTCLECGICLRAKHGLVVFRPH